MADPESHTLRLLREFRQEFAEYRKEFNEFRASTNERFDRSDERFDELTRLFAGESVLAAMPRSMWRRGSLGHWSSRNNQVSQAA